VANSTLARDAGMMADDSIIPRRGIREAISEAGKIRGPAQQLQRRLLRVNEVVDEFARAAVFHQGRRLNLSPEDAWTRSTEAMVDYMNLSGFERAAVRSVIPFYAWQKGILKVTMNQALDHPGRVSVLMLLGRMNEEYIADYFGLEPEDIPDYYKQLLGNRNLRSYNPFADPADLLTPEGIVRSMNPFIEIGLRKGLGAPEFYPDQQRLGFFGQPQADVNVASELAGLLTRSPGGRIVGSEPGGDMVETALGLRELDPAELRSRFLRTRRRLRGIENPETGQEGSGFLIPPRRGTG
jgi:hypothetical protein